jgi:hypothetical protein
MRIGLPVADAGALPAPPTPAVPVGVGVAVVVVPAVPLAAVVPVLGVQQTIDRTVRAGSSSTCCRVISIKLSALDIKSS